MPLLQGRRRGGARRPQALLDVPQAPRQLAQRRLVRRVGLLDVGLARLEQPGQVQDLRSGRGVGEGGGRVA